MNETDSLSISFEVCQGVFCAPNRYDYLQRRTFYFSLGENRLDLYSKDQVSKEIDTEAIVYPYNPY